MVCKTHMKMWFRTGDHQLCSNIGQIENERAVVKVVIAAMEKRDDYGERERGERDSYERERGRENIKKETVKELERERERERKLKKNEFLLLQSVTNVE